MQKEKFDRLRCFLIFISFLHFASCKVTENNSVDCKGRRRWDVKTLTDKSSDKINFSPTDTAISDLIKTSPSVIIKHGTPRFGKEFRTYKIRCYLKQYEVKKDGDYHLVMVDIKDTTSTMIGEIPDPDCGDARNSKYLNNFIEARKAVQNFMTGASKIKPGVYEITGVAFYDKVQPNVGAALTGIEIHPILSIVKLQD